MDTAKKYYAKVMLAGEYAAIIGGEALTVPLRQFSAELKQRTQAMDHDKAERSIADLNILYQYLDSRPKNSFNASPNLPKFNDIIQQGYFIESSIPMGYGIGSSAAVSALVYDQFFEAQQNLSLQQKKDDLAIIESCFHGKSSGVDALSSYLDQPVHFTSTGPEPIHDTAPLLPGKGYRFFLVDSQTTLKTAPLVKYFNSQMEETAFRKAMITDLLPLNSKFIASLTNKSSADPATIFSAISNLQWNYFRKMIPESIEDIWIQGMVTNLYYLKLNGSGGGFMLGMAHEDSLTYISKLFEGLNHTWLQ